VPFHCATEDGMKPVPVRVMAVTADPATIEFGVTDVTTGVGGLVMFTVTALERDGFAAGVLTVTLADPIWARSAAGTDALSVLLPLNDVVRAAPFHCTTEEGVKPVPVMVMAVTAVPAKIEFGVRDVITGVGGPMMVMVTALEIDGFAPGVLTVTVADPVWARSVAGMDALSALLPMSDVVRAAPFHCTTEEGVKPVPVMVMAVTADPA